MVTTQRTTTTRQPSRAARRFGYVLGAAINGLMLVGANVWPGWDVLPFLTDDFTTVLPLVNASIVVGVVANLVYVVDDRRRVKAFGDLVTTAVGLLVVLRLWQVFPFDFSGSTFDWELVARVLLGLGVVGSAIGLVVALVQLVTGRPRRP